MLVFQKLSFVFGDKKLSCASDILKKTDKLSDSMALEPFLSLRRTCDLCALIFPRQVHGVKVLELVDQKSIDRALLTHQDADIVSTNREGVGIGVLTADCLPLILYSPQKNALAVVHAGWRGTVQNCAAVAVEHLKRTYGCDSCEIFAFFGPCAHVALYEASPELCDALEKSHYRELVFEKKGSAIHFNLIRMNQLQLEAVGVPACNCIFDYSKDTIADSNYWSYRRDGGGDEVGRQITMAFLKGEFYESACCTISY